jgi:hypothetical protein
MSITTAAKSCGFEAPRSIEVGYNVTPVAVGDFDGNGKGDLAFGDCCSTTQTQVGVMLGNGDGTFRARVDHALPDFPNTIGVVDVTGDGHLDVILTLTTTINPTVSFLVNNGDGTFQPSRNFIPFAVPSDAAWGDFDHDGTLDFVIGAADCDCVTTLRGDGAGGVASQYEWPTPSGTNYVAVADFDNDGNDDLAAMSLVGRELYTLRGNGDGTFQAPMILPPGGDVVTGDFDGDGNADLATSGAILFGRGDGTLDTPVPVPSGGFLASGDLDRDGLPDLVGLGPTMVTAAYSHRDRTFTEVDLPITGNFESIALGDIDGDGQLDVVVSDGRSTQLQWLRGVCN